MQNSTHTNGWGLVAMVLLSALCAASSCDDAPTKPEPAREYLAYFYDAEDQENWYFNYNPYDNTMDSVFLPYWHYPVLSADGRRMYIANFATGETDILEVDSFTVIKTLPYERPIVASPDGKWLAVYSDGIHLLRANDHVEVFYDSSLAGEYFTFAGCFSSSGSAYYGLPKSGHVRRIDLTSGNFDTNTITVPFGGVYDLAPAPDESQLYLSLQNAGGGAFAVLDLALDSVIYVDALWPGFVNLVVRPDGKYVFYSHPDWFSGPTAGDPWLNVYDVENRALLTRISTVGSLPPPFDSIGIPLGQLCITPDGEKLVALPSKGAPLIYCFDPRAMTILSVWERSSASSFEGLTCQNRR